MSDAKDTTTTETRSIFLSLYLAGNSSHSKEKEFVEESLMGYFPKAFVLDHEDPQDVQERELVYRIDFDWPAAVQSHLDVFIRLESLLTELAPHSPSFTQGSEAFA